MSVYNCSEATMHSVISMCYLSGVVKYELVPGMYDPATDRYSLNHKVSFNQNGVVVEKTLTHSEVQTFMSNLKNLSDMLDTITDDIRKE